MMFRAKVIFGLACAVLLQGMPGYAMAQELAVVARHIIYPGQMIEQTSIEVVDASNCPNCDAGYIQDAAVVAGKIAIKTLEPGKLIFPGDIRMAPAVIRGEEVTVLYRKGALQISMSGIPLNEAAVGESVSIRNAESGAIVSGVVQADGTVMVAK